MNEFIVEEENLKFDFTHCGKPVKFDIQNSSGLYAVDFFVNREKYLLFIEVKDYQNPYTPHTQQKDDYSMLLKAGKDQDFCLCPKMGATNKRIVCLVYMQKAKYLRKMLYTYCS